MQWAPSSPWLSFDPKQFSIEPKTLILCWFGSGVATAVVPHNLIRANSLVVSMGWR